MNSNPSVEKNKEILKKLLKKDPVKYKNFDRVAEYVLEAPIDEENKSVTLHIMSKIFVALHESNKNWELGRNKNAAKIAEMNDLYKQTNLHIAAIKRLIQPNPKLTPNLYEAMLNIIDDYVKNPKVITLRKDYQNDILYPIARFFLIYFLKSDKKKQALITQVKSNLENIKTSFTKVINQKKNQMLRSLVSTYNKKAGTDEYKKALGVIFTESKKIVYESYVDKGKDTGAKIERMAKEISDAFQVIGLPLPKSLLRLSLLGISIVEKGESPKMDPRTKTGKFYANDERFVLEGKYLQKDFFYDFLNVTKTLAANVLSAKELAERLDDNNDSLARMSIILRKASAYIITNDFRYLYNNISKQLDYGD